MILCTGELIADISVETLPDIGEVMRRRAGGAPFNVACDIKALGGEAGFYGCIGSDMMGDMLAAEAEKTGIAPLLLRRDARRHTAIAFVEIGPDGDRSFEFRASRAADCAPDAAELETLLPTAEILHLGSLMLREKCGRQYAAAAVGLARDRGIKVSFDVNLRAGLYPSLAAAVRATRPVIAAADILKLSEDEAMLFTSAPDAQSAAASLACGDKTVFVTMGARGACCARGDECISLPSPTVRVVNATGCGDAFFAAALLSLERDPEDISAALAEGVRAGAACAQSPASHL